MKREDMLGALSEIVACSDGQWITIRVRGNCMRPGIEAGHRATLIRRSVYVPGDIVVFRTSTDLVAHRLLGYAPVNGRLGFVTKGDRCIAHDGVVSTDRVLGRLEIRVGLRDRVASFIAYLSAIGRRLLHRS